MKKAVLIILTVIMVLITGKNTCHDSLLGKIDKNGRKKYAKYMI